MNRARPLSRVLAPVPGESFPSFVDRLSALHQCSRLVMLQSLGIIEDQKNEKLSGYGVIVSSEKLEQMSVATHVSVDDLRRTLLAHYFTSDQARNKLDESRMHLVATQEWLYFSGSHFCPMCLKEDSGAWQLKWKLPWSFVCVRHGTYLETHCHQCDKRAGRGKSDRSLTPHFVKHKARPGFCNNPQPKGQAKHGVAAEPCNAALFDVKPSSASTYLVTLQRRIDQVLDGQPGHIAGEEVSSDAFIKTLRSLCALVLYGAEMDSIVPLAEPERTALENHTKIRNRRVAHRKESASPRNEERNRVFIGPPEDPALLAALVTASFAILDAPDLESLTNRLTSIAENCKRRYGKTRWEIANYFSFSGPLAKGFERALATSSKFDRAIGKNSSAGRTANYDFEPKHVPQLLWEDLYKKKFKVLLPNIQDNHGRRFCSMSLLRLVEEFTWEQAGSYLGLPASSLKMANKAVVTLNLNDKKEAFSQALHAAAFDLSEQVQKSDFAELRAKLCQLREVPMDDWTSICASAGMSVGETRNKYAAAWLWARMTSGDWTLAPALHGGKSVV